jgi:hypothetical protein
MAGALSRSTKISSTESDLLWFIVDKCLLLIDGMVVLF